MTTAFADLAERLAAGHKLSNEDAAALAAASDLPTLGMAADEARRRRHGDRVTFVRVVECAMDSVLESAPDGRPATAGEIRIVGAPRTIDDAVAAVQRAVVAAQGVCVRGFSLADLETAAQAGGVALADALARLADAGLAGVADAPVDALAAAEASIESAARMLSTPPVLTVSASDGLDLALFERVVRLQQSVGALRAFAPLPRTSPTAASPSTGFDDTRRIALARLLVDNIDSIQVDWAAYGPKLAQVALLFGADDVDRVSTSEEGGRRSPLEEIRRNIRAASLTPVERNGCFQPMES